uniref:DRBM domain-containing protein n=1 Tax=Panagrolaimus sp. JU765 TaxID=591449 RepID=A0AC34PUW2_9BILA
MSDDEEKLIQQQRKMILALLGSAFVDPDAPKQVVDVIDYANCFDGGPRITQVRLDDTPMARLLMGFKIRNFDPPVLEYSQNDNKIWTATLRDGEKVYQGDGPDKQTAHHIAACFALEYLIEKGWAQNNEENSFMLPYDPKEALEFVRHQRHQLEKSAKFEVNPVSAICEYCQFRKLEFPSNEQFEDDGNNPATFFKCSVVFNGKTFTGTGQRKKTAKNAAFSCILSELRENGEWANFYLERQQNQAQKKENWTQRCLKYAESDQQAKTDNWE